MSNYDKTFLKLILMLILIVLPLPWLLFRVDWAWNLSEPTPGQFVWTQSPGTFWYVALVLRLGLLALFVAAFFRGRHWGSLVAALIPSFSLLLLTIPLRGTGDRFPISNDRIGHQRIDGTVVWLRPAEIVSAEVRGEESSVGRHSSAGPYRTNPYPHYLTILKLTSQSGVTLEIPVREERFRSNYGNSFVELLLEPKGFFLSDEPQIELKAALARVLPPTLKEWRNFPY